MDTLIVTLDALYAAIDGPYAAKGGHFAVKESESTANCEPVVGIAGHIAGKNRECKRSRGVFAVMERTHAAMKGHNAAKRLSFAAMGVHYARMGTSNTAIGALIAAKCAFNLAM